MSIRGRRNKRNVVRIVIVHAGKRNEKVVSIRAMARNLTTSVFTVKVDSRMFRPELSAVTQIVLGNLHVLR